MATVALTTVGCRLNQCETEQWASELVSKGLQRVDYSEQADIYVLNTCTVTHKADADCRNLVRRAFRRNNRAVIVVAGCYVDADRERIEALDGVSFALGNADKDRLAAELEARYPALFRIDAAEEHHIGTMTFGDYSRAMVKVGDGCNQWCSFCIIPSVRGKLTSRPSEEIVSEVQSYAEAGHHEVVLTAVHIGMYKEGKARLADLMEMLLEQTSIARIRLSSIEPNEVNGRIIDMVAHHPRICRHLHLPLQSGSDRILKLMRRPYNQRGYLNVAEKAKRANAEITVGSDVIVGFPGEMQEDFGGTLDVLSSGLVDYSHVFAYSDRQGTVASKIQEKIPPQVIKERSKRAREMARKRRIKYIESQIGKRLEVIPESRANGNGHCVAVSDNYVQSHVPSSYANTNAIIPFRALRRTGQILEGKVLQS